MKLYDRIILGIVLVLACLILAVVSAMAVLFSVKAFSLTHLWTRLEYYFYGRWEVGVVGGIFFMVSLWLLLSGLRSQKAPQALISSGELGSVNISFNAVQNLVLKVTRDMEEIRDVKVKIKQGKESLSIILQVVVVPDVKIPELTAKLQKAVKDYVESMAGIAIKDVSINVENIAGQYKQNVK
ncbi:alkaline shock response membrane anchor protein AmaP [Thermosediminibacter litoriperuensis]|uniref:Putative alkaline shock family protein YloU n=1 Tax=Thermosediminibacter litoriperuensis TaxID=291989 RepID=A0A5S5AKM0_9FIRM|nr:alkaline shock response membrane anchor protein AmaP [Thermosediminibacter litoriperuensis]TYP51637.1 putative alkaline shock family protein YloU [Thermosediminibacter litoriperuensis]